VIRASQLLLGGLDIKSAGAEVFQILAEEIPTARLSRSELEGMGVTDALVRAGLAQSKGEARRGVEQRGFSINGAPVGDVDRKLGPGDLLAGNHVLLQKGRKAFALLIAA